MNNEFNDLNKLSNSIRETAMHNSNTLNNHSYSKHNNNINNIEETHFSAKFKLLVVFMLMLAYIYMDITDYQLYNISADNIKNVIRQDSAVYKDFEETLKSLE